MKKMIGETKLEKAVAKIINSYAKDYDNGVAGFLEDLMSNGCSSGLVGELIYYSDTTKFFNKHREEISELLADACESAGGGPEMLFGDKWDKEDPLAHNESNKNLLAWFAFEETARRLGEEQGFIEN